MIEFLINLKKCTIVSKLVLIHLLSIQFLGLGSILACMLTFIGYFAIHALVSL